MALTQTIAFDKELDCRGLVCPLPILHTRKAIETLQVGQVLKMTSTDLAAVVDVQAWARRTGHALLGYEDDSNTFTFYIKKTH
ncbi:MAG TPA: sulfurtransferase TusA family protein [Anaerolineae bacterium]